MRSFFFGLAFGLGLGLLFAPMSGEESREKLGERASDLAGTARQRYEEGRDRFRRGTEELRKGASRAVSELRTGTGESGS
jgi:gas vesicle protein